MPLPSRSSIPTHLWLAPDDAISFFIAPSLWRPANREVDSFEICPHCCLSVHRLLRYIDAQIARVRTVRALILSFHSCGPRSSTCWLASIGSLFISQLLCLSENTLFDAHFFASRYSLLASSLRGLGQLAHSFFIFLSFCQQPTTSSPQCLLFPVYLPPPAQQTFIAEKPDPGLLYFQTATPHSLTWTTLSTLSTVWHGHLPLLHHLRAARLVLRDNTFSRFHILLLSLGPSFPQSVLSCAAWPTRQDKSRKTKDKRRALAPISARLSSVSCPRHCQYSPVTAIAPAPAPATRHPSSSPCFSVPLLDLLHKSHSSS